MYGIELMMSGRQTKKLSNSSEEAYTLVKIKINALFSVVAAKIEVSDYL